MNILQKIYLNLTTKCNFICKKCWRRHVYGLGKNLDADILDAIFGQLSKYRGKLVIGSGENLIYPHLDSVINWANAYEVDLTILTTAFNLATKPAHYFSSNIIWGITFDSFSQERINRYQKGLNINKVKHGIKFIRNNYATSSMYLNYTLYASNCCELIDFIEFSHSIKVNNVYVTPVKLYQDINHFELENESINFDSAIVQSLLNHVLSVNKEFNGVTKVHFSKPRRINFSISNCIPSPVIRTDGQFSFCQGREDYAIGNIMNLNLVKTWHDTRQHLDFTRFCLDCNMNKRSELGHHVVPTNLV